MNNRWNTKLHVGIAEKGSLGSSPQTSPISLIPFYCGLFGLGFVVLEYELDSNCQLYIMLFLMKGLENVMFLF